MLFNPLLAWFSTDLGIDLGTANTLVCVKGGGIVLSEPSVVAVVKGTNQVMLNGNAVGLEAKKMLGKTPGNIEAIRPLKNGVIADFDITEAMLTYFIRKVHNRRWGISPRVVISIPSGITAVEERAVKNSAERAGAREVYLLEEPMAAAIGIGQPIAEPVGSMVVDIGGGTTEVAVISLAGIVAGESVRVAGDAMDDAILNYLKRNYNLAIGESTAERIKMEIGSAHALEEEMTMEVRGRDLIAGLPRKITINSEEIREALQEPVNAIIGVVKSTLEKTPPELAGDLVDQGLVIVGGGALLRGLDKVFAEETGLPVHIGDDPLTAVARGTAKVLDSLDKMKIPLSMGRRERR